MCPCMRTCTTSQKSEKVKGEVYLSDSHLCLLLLLLELLLQQLDLVVDRQGGTGRQRTRRREEHPGTGHQQRRLFRSLEGKKMGSTSK